MFNIIYDIEHKKCITRHGVSLMQLLCAINNKSMRNPILIIFFLILCSCATSEFDKLLTDLEKNEITQFSYKVGGFNTFKCDPFAAQKILKAWSGTLKEAGIASWPSPDNYLELSINNGNKYNVKTFIGSDNLNYSVLYTNGVYTGEKLEIENVCPTN